MKIFNALLLAAMVSTVPNALNDCGTPTSPDDDLDGFTVADGDCDDNNTFVFPGAYETVTDGIDSNCNTHSDFIDNLAGTGVSGSAGDGGPADSARLANPFHAVADGLGNTYIADTANHRIRKVDASGIITTVVGNGTSGFSGDGGPAVAAQVYTPKGLAVDAAGNLFISDAGNQRVRRVDATTGVITTVAGNGTEGFAGDGGSATAARLAWPYGVAVDSNGVLFIADSNNHRVRKVSGGVINTVVGTGLPGFSGDGGTATTARLNFPRAVALSGNTLYIADTNNYRIRMVSSGTISTVAGSGTDGYSGDGGPATSAALNDPYGVAVDGFGDLYIADTDNNRVRKVIGGTISTVVGTGTAGNTGNGTEDASYTSQINVPFGVSVDIDGDLLVTEGRGGMVRTVRW